ncbi:DUF4188 domain-containing protein [Thermoleptolyngbya sp. C42_A2020_037]|uniref:DUF4188 domain-containing protein n=1 Tax=Thermoleptolyngbya sp. C42_A2020_037 TaxID=2747799 RepID=UPI0019FA606D|nr:DUF4188 domain-containing protein [Thermoleptolyngbya sp. C42_A2020_037]MBF2085916.1 DUF4188 domain-containing protein [Thermoleptolyngbya sp. C42_A2020_037]
MNPLPSPPDSAQSSAQTAHSLVKPGRYTAQIDTEFVVFLIGMRVNQPWAFGKWLPVAQAMGPMIKTLTDFSQYLKSAIGAQAMGPMIKTLTEHPEKGFLGAESFFRLFPLGIMMMSYWRSFEDLERFARSPSEPHLPAWQAFNKAVGSDGSVGIWHETYLIQPGQYEAIYGSMPVFGLAAATEHVPVGRRGERARERVKSAG